MVDSADFQEQIVDWAFSVPSAPGNLHHVRTKGGEFWTLVSVKSDSAEIQIGNSRGVRGVVRLILVNHADLPTWTTIQQPLHLYTEPPVGPPEVLAAVRKVLDPMLQAVIKR